MGFDRGPADGPVRLDEGSATLEGVAALGLAFLLLTIVVQVATAITAQSAARAAVAAAARRAALPGADIDAEAARLGQIIEATVPGAGEVDVAIQSGSTTVRAIAAFRWVPPGPDLRPFTIRVSADAQIVLAP